MLDEKQAKYLAIVKAGQGEKSLTRDELTVRLHLIILAT